MLIWLITACANQETFRERERKLNIKFVWWFCDKTKARLIFWLLKVACNNTFCCPAAEVWEGTLFTRLQLCSESVMHVALSNNNLSAKAHSYFCSSLFFSMIPSHYNYYKSGPTKRQESAEGARQRCINRNLNPLLSADIGDRLALEARAAISTWGVATLLCEQCC